MTPMTQPLAAPVGLGILLGLAGLLCPLHEIYAMPHPDSANDVENAHGPNWSTAVAYQELFDVERLERIKGTLISIHEFSPKKNLALGTMLTMERDGKAPISVHLGPAWYLREHRVRLVPSQSITVTGVLVTFEGQEVMIAKDIFHQGVTLELRDNTGRPLWWPRSRRAPFRKS